MYLQQIFNFLKKIIARPRKWILGRFGHSRGDIPLPNSPSNLRPYPRFCRRILSPSGKDSQRKKRLPHRIYYRQWFFTPESTRARRFLSPPLRVREVGCSISQMKYYYALHCSKKAGTESAGREISARRGKTLETRKAKNSRRICIWPLRFPTPILFAKSFTIGTRVISLYLSLYLRVFHLAFSCNNCARYCGSSLKTSAVYIPTYRRFLSENFTIEIIRELFYQLTNQASSRVWLNFWHEWRILIYSSEFSFNSKVCVYRDNAEKLKIAKIWQWAKFLLRKNSFKTPERIRSWGST